MPILESSTAVKTVVMTGGKCYEETIVDSVGDDPVGLILRLLRVGIRRFRQGSHRGGAEPGQ